MAQRIVTCVALEGGRQMKPQVRGSLESIRARRNAILTTFFAGFPPALCRRESAEAEALGRFCKSPASLGRRLCELCVSDKITNLKGVCVFID